jgi:hypothetical protein
MVLTSDERGRVLPSKQALFNRNEDPMVNDLQQFDAADDNQVAGTSSISNVHVKKNDEEGAVRALQQLNAPGAEQTLGMSSISNVHVG